MPCSTQHSADIAVQTMFSSKRSGQARSSFSAYRQPDCFHTQHAGINWTGQVPNPCGLTITRSKSEAHVKKFSREACPIHKNVHVLRWSAVL